MVTVLNPSAKKGQSISRGKAPRNASMYALPLNFNLDLVLKFTAEFPDGIQNVMGIEGIQSIFIDNSQNSDVLVLTFNNTYNLTCPAYAMGIFPVFFNGTVMDMTATASVAVQCQVVFLNTREQAQIWTAKIPVAGTINVSGSQVFIQPSQGTFIARSVDLTLGGTSQQIMAANANRRALCIRNPATPTSQNVPAPEPLYISFGASAAIGALGTWELLPGEQLPQFLTMTTQSVFVNATTTGHRVTAYEI